MLYSCNTPSNSPPILFSIQAGHQGKTVSKSGRLGQFALLSRRTCMMAVLQTAGPASTHVAIRSNWRFLRAATIKQFLGAATELEKLGFGRVVQLTGRLTQKIFLKKSPDEVQELLAANPDLCSPDIHRERYQCQATKKIGWQIRAQLISMRLVSEKQFL